MRSFAPTKERPILSLLVFIGGEVQFHAGAASFSSIVLTFPYSEF